MCHYVINEMFKDVYIIFKFKGFQRAFTIRYWTGKALIALTGIYAAAYYFKYNQNVSGRKTSITLFI